MYNDNATDFQFLSTYIIQYGSIPCHGMCEARGFNIEKCPATTGVVYMNVVCVCVCVN